MRIARLTLALVLGCALAPAWAATQNPPRDRPGYTPEEVLAKARTFFGETTAGLAKAVENVFADYGTPNALILGEEGGGAIGVGVRYGKGTLETRGGERREIWWHGPSVGFDVGGNASKVFTLVYHLDKPEQLYQRFPGVEGSLYFVAGLSANYHKSGDVILAPIRTGVGWRQGAAIGYIVYTKEKTISPL